MGSYAEIKKGVCVNVVVCETAEDAAAMGFVPLPDGYGIGDKYSGQKWTARQRPATQEAMPVPPEDIWAQVASLRKAVDILTAGAPVQIQSEVQAALGGESI